MSNIQRFKMWCKDDNGNFVLLHPETSIQQVVGLQEALDATIRTVNNIEPDNNMNVTTEIVYMYGYAAASLADIISNANNGIRQRVKVVISGIIYFADLSYVSPSMARFVCPLSESILIIELDNNNSWLIRETSVVDPIFREDLVELNEALGHNIITIYDEDLIHGHISVSGDLFDLEINIQEPELLPVKHEFFIILSGGRRTGVSDAFTVNITNVYFRSFIIRTAGSLSFNLSSLNQVMLHCIFSETTTPGILYIIPHPFSLGI